MARGEASQAAWERQHKSQLHEVLTEEYDNRIYSAANRLQPQHFQLSDTAKGRQPQDASDNPEAMSEVFRMPPTSPRPLPPLISLPGSSKDRVLVGGQEKDKAADTDDRYYDALHTQDNSLLEEYMSHYDYGLMPEENYLEEYELDTPIPSSQILAFSTSQTISSAVLSTAAGHPQDFSHPPQNYIRGSPGRRSLSDRRESLNVNREREIQNQSGIKSTDLFSSQGLEDMTTSKGIQPTAALMVGYSTNPSNINFRPATPLREREIGDQSYDMRKAALQIQQVGNIEHLSEGSHDSTSTNGTYPATSGEFDYFGNHGNEGESSTWDEKSIRDEAIERNNRQHVSPVEHSVTDESENTTWTTTDERTDEKDVAEINKSRIRETEKLIDILDDILREVNITEQLFRSPRQASELPSHISESPQPENPPPYIISSSLSRDSIGTVSEGTVSSSTDVRSSQRPEETYHHPGKSSTDNTSLIALETPVEREEKGRGREED